MEEIEKKEIIWNVINSLLAGGLVFLGSLLDGKITTQGCIAALIAAGIIALTKFRDFWQTEKPSAVFDFI
jgi:hypothetical protein